MTSYVQISNTAFPCLEAIKSQFPQYQALICEIQGELNLRLWHQLSNHLIELSDKSELQSNSTALIELYGNVLKSIEPAFNTMKIMIILKNVIKNFQGRLEEAIIFLDDINRRLNLQGESLLFMYCLKADCLLGLSKLHECNDMLKSIKVSLEKVFDVDHIVYAYFYKLYAYYYVRKGNYDEFYNYALQFFAYYKEDSILKEEKLDICYKMALASLIGEKMFNFTELVEKEFFKVLIGGEYEWIYHLILSLNTGKVDHFKEMLQNYDHQVQSDQVLKNKIHFLDMKVRVAALLDLVFQKNKNERVFSYREISLACSADHNTVELICMKALSLGLIKGHIDEIENQLVVTWIQPKFLDREKLGLLNERLDSWIKRTNQVLFDFEEKTKGLIN